MKDLGAQLDMDKLCFLRRVYAEDPFSAARE